MIRLPAGAMETILREARESYPEECCGALLGREGPGDGRSVLRAVPVRNTRDDGRERRYLIGPEVVRALEEEAMSSGLDVLGFFHSHPDHPAIPSEFDRDHAWPWYSYVIVPVAAGEPGRPRAWRLTPDREGFSEIPLVSQDREDAPAGEPRVAGDASIEWEVGA